jgi:type IV pilus assembly protein PilB
MPVARFDNKILDILVHNESLNEEQRAEVLKTLEKEEHTVDEVLLENGFLDEESYIGAVAKAVNLPPINLRKVHPDPALREQIPEDIAKFHNVFPIARIGNILTVAVANPFDIINHDDFKIVVGCELQKVISTVPAIKKVIYDYYHSEEVEL